MCDSGTSAQIPDFGPSKYDRGLAIHDERIRNHPSDASAYRSRGRWHQWHEANEEALADYDRAIELDPGLASAYCFRASLRASCPDGGFRDGRQALDDARKAIKLAEEAGMFIGDWRQRLCLQVLAAAHAEVGDFEAAAAVQAEALNLAVTQSTRSRIREILERYREGRAHRDQHGLGGTDF